MPALRQHPWVNAVPTYGLHKPVGIAQLTDSIAAGFAHFQWLIDEGQRRVAAQGTGFHFAQVHL